MAEIPFEAEWWGALLDVDGNVWLQEASVHDSTVAAPWRLVQLDPETGDEVTSVSLEDEDGFTAGAVEPVSGGGAIWAANGSELLRIDPASGEVSWRISAAIGFDIELGSDGAIWYLGRWESLHRLDPTTGETDVTVQLERGIGPIAIAVAEDAVWILNYQGTLTRVALG